MDIYELYKFDSSQDIINNSDNIRKITDYLKNYKNGEKPLLIAGPSGTGKTSIINFILKKLNYNIVNLDASDYRDKDTIEKKLVSASHTTSLFNNKNVIVLDEIDDLNNKYDAGASTAILKLIKESSNPIIFIANDAWDKKIGFLRNKVDTINFRSLTQSEIRELLEYKIKKFNLKVKTEMVDFIVKQSNGDARAALNDLFTISIDIGDANELEEYSMAGLRSNKMDIFKFLDKVFMANTFSSPLIALSSIDLDNDMIVQWLSENIPNIYKGKDVQKALDNLALATMYNNRASRKQYYLYWRYRNVFMTSGISLSKSKYYLRSSSYNYPKNIRELSKSKEDRKKLNLILDKLKRTIKESRFNLREYYIPIMREMVKENNKAGEMNRVYEFFELKYNLSKEDVDFIKDH